MSGCAVYPHHTAQHHHHNTLITFRCLSLTLVTSSMCTPAALCVCARVCMCVCVCVRVCPCRACTLVQNVVVVLLSVVAQASSQRVAPGRRGRPGPHAGVCVCAHVSSIDRVSGSIAQHPTHCYRWQVRRDILGWFGRGFFLGDCASPCNLFRFRGHAEHADRGGLSMARRSDSSKAIGVCDGTWPTS